MRRFRGVFSRIALVVAPPIPPAEATPERLQARCSRCAASGADASRRTALRGAGGRRSAVLHSFGLVGPAAESLPPPTHVRQHPRQAVLRHFLRRVARAGDRLRRRRLPAGPGARRRRHPARPRPAQAGHLAPRDPAARVRHRRDPVRRVRGPHHRHADRAADPQRGPAQQGLRATSPTTFRPGHADYTYWQKYGIRDYRGGGRSSARETAVRVAAGAIARKWLRERYGVVVRGYLAQLGPQRDPVRVAGTASTTIRSSSPTPAIVPELEAYMDRLRKSGDSVRRARSPWWPSGVPVGWGEPVYDRLDADIALRDDGHQRGQGRRDRRRLRAASRRRAPSTPTR